MVFKLYSKGSVPRIHWRIERSEGMDLTRPNKRKSLDPINEPRSSPKVWVQAPMTSGFLMENMFQPRTNAEGINGVVT